MRFGLTAFCTDRSVAPGALASRVEAAGFDLLLFPDHTHIPVNRRSPYPGGTELPDFYARTVDPLVACTAAAASTTRLCVGVGVCLVPARDPIVLAKQVASVDLLSHGRMVLGVGAGWNREEIEDHGVAAADRWAVMRERVLAMRAIWRDDEAEFHGAHVAFGPMWSWPKPVRHGVPVLVGGHGAQVLHRVVEYGDEWLAMVAPGLPPLGERMARLAELADAAGRDRPAVSVQVYGSPPPERIIERYVSLGVDRIDLSLPHGDDRATDEHLAVLADVVARWSDAS
jgi:probable F420-dependent oxidoreductase